MRADAPPRYLGTAELATEGEGGSLGTAWVIEYQGLPWLVPYWLDLPNGRETMPARIILMATIAHQIIPGGFLINHSLPKELFDDPLPLTRVAGYTVVERPPIVLPIPS